MRRKWMFIAPAAILGIASALLVLWRKPLGVRLARPLCIVLVITAVWTFFELAPVGRFLDDYQAAALGAIILVVLYGATVLRGSRKPKGKPAEATAGPS